MSKKKLVIIILLVLAISLSLLFINPNIRKSFKRLFANINDASSTSYIMDKDYSVGDEVYYNPVSNTWCTSEDEANNCFSWFVLNNNYDKLELIYKKDNDAFKVPSSTSQRVTTVVDDINSITSSWSTDLTITNPKYKMFSSVIFGQNTIDFSNSKARLSYRTETTAPLYKKLKDNSYCGVNNQPCIMLYDVDGEESNSNFNAWGILSFQVSDTVSNGGPITQAPISPGYFYHPVIEVDREKYEVNINPKEILNDERNYLMGLIGVVYLDPTDLTRTCTKADSDANVNQYGTPTNITEGCMKWYIIGEEGEYYKLFLNHNTTALAIYNRNDNSYEMVEGKQALNSDTINWDVSARLISVEDIAEIEGIEYDPDTGMNEVYYPYTHMPYSSYAFLFDYLSNGVSPNSAYADNNSYTAGDGYGTSTIEAYWTSTPAGAVQVRTVDETGSLYYRNAYSTSSTGIRPLIKLPKSIFYEGLTITYNDENRITTKSARYDSKIENIESQGKTGYLFDHWSLERNGEAFDFDTKVTRDTTLYAVYKTRNCITEKYDLGEIVYFDPVSDAKCDETTFDINKINAGTSTCYKWRVISVNDSLGKNKVNLMLDHNLINYDDWSTEATLYLPNKALPDLATATSTWTRVPNLNYSYDTTIYETNARRHYGLLKCTNGTCTITKDGSTDTIATNVKARLITLDEIEKMVAGIDATKVWAYEYEKEVGRVIHKINYTRDIQSISRNAMTLEHNIINVFYYAQDPTSPFNSSLGIRSNTELAWLGENTKNSEWAPTATNNAYGSNNSGYYTLTPNVVPGYGYLDTVWAVYPDNMSTSQLAVSNPYSQEDRQGLRPVIELEKENMCSNVLVTYNDEDRISEEEIEKGSTAPSKTSQGKEGHTFKHWSLEKNGSAFNFNTPINTNTTLYAVYEINKFNVEFYDDNSKIKTVVVDWNNTINNVDVPTVSKEGYTFTFWGLDGATEGFDFTTHITEDYRLYSNYKIIENEVIFNDENRITTKIVPWGSKVTAIEELGKEGYTFKYWSTDKNGDAFNFNTLIKSSTTLYAVYEIITYDVEFYVDNEVVETLTINYNGVINESDIPNASKDRYKFLGWREEGEDEYFDFDIHILKNYKLHAYYEPEEDPVPEDKCELDISSGVYKVDNENYIISMVPKDETIEQIMSHLIIKGDVKEVSDEKIVITCKDTTRVYTIKRYWIPHTGNMIIRYSLYFMYAAIFVSLLIFINNQRNKNRELKSKL